MDIHVTYIPVPQLSLPVSYLVSYLLNITEHPEHPKSANRDLRELFSERSDRSIDPFLSLVSFYVSFSLFFFLFLIRFL